MGMWYFFTLLLLAARQGEDPVSGEGFENVDSTRRLQGMVGVRTNPWISSA